MQRTATRRAAFMPPRVFTCLCCECGNDAPLHGSNRLLSAFQVLGMLTPPPAESALRHADSALLCGDLDPRAVRCDHCRCTGVVRRPAISPVQTSKMSRVSSWRHSRFMRPVLEKRIGRTPGIAHRPETALPAHLPEPASCGRRPMPRSSQRAQSRNGFKDELA
jgi:hypothetical protein